MAWLKHVAHIVILGVILPVACGIPAVMFGAIIAAIEGWSFVDGLLYIGGDLVLVQLTPLAPTTTEGRIVDFILSCLALGVFAWILALLGALPICDDTKSVMENFLERCIKLKKGNLACAMVTVLIFIHVCLPLVCFLCAFPFGGILAPIEGWTFQAAFDIVLGIVGHCPAFIPPGHAPTTSFGKLVALLVAFYALAISVGWSVGVMLAMPALSKFDDTLAAFTRAELRLPPTLLGRGTAFFVIAGIGIPVVLLPIVFAGGVILKYVEDWPSFMDSVLHVAGNLVLMNLVKTPIPMSTFGKIVDFVISTSGVGAFAFFIAVLGGLPFTDHCADVLGGKREGRLPAVKFAVLFFMFVLPLVCAITALPLGGLLALAEKWSFSDSWLFALGIMVQSPGLPPPTLVLTTDFGKFVCFIVIVWGMCLSVGWGAGVIVATAGLDEAAKFVTSWMGGSADSADSNETEAKALPAAVSDATAEQAKTGAVSDDSVATTTGVAAEENNVNAELKGAASAESPPTTSDVILVATVDNANSGVQTNAAQTNSAERVAEGNGSVVGKPEGLTTVDIDVEVPVLEEVNFPRSACRPGCCA